MPKPKGMEKPEKGDGCKASPLPGDLLRLGQGEYWTLTCFRSQRVSYFEALCRIYVGLHSRNSCLQQGEGGFAGCKQKVACFLAELNGRDVESCLISALEASRPSTQCRALRAPVLTCMVHLQNQGASPPNPSSSWIAL